MQVKTEVGVTAAEVVEEDLRTLLYAYKEDLLEVREIINPLRHRVVAARTLRHMLNPLRECYYKLSGRPTMQFRSLWPSTFEQLFHDVELELKAVSAFLER